MSELSEVSESKGAGSQPVHSGWVAVDLFAVVGLSVVALVGLDDSFSTRSYLVTGLAAVLAVTVWAWICAAQRYAVGVYLLVLSAGFPVLGATVAMRNYDLLGFPAPFAVADLLTATLTAPARFLTTIPPVDATGDVLAIPYVIGYFLCGPAAWWALSTARPLLPVLPLLTAYVACIVLDTDEPLALLARSAAFAGVALAWVVVRAARERSRATVSRGQGLRAVVGTVVVVGAVLLAAAWVPGVAQQDRTVLRGRIGSGQDVSQLDNPLSSFRKFTDQPRGAADNVADARLLRVTGLPPRALLRFVALDVYDGSAWVAGNRTVPDDSSALFQRIGERVAAPYAGRRVRVGVEVQKSWTSSWLPLTGQLTGISFDYLDGEAQREDVRYNVATRTAMVVGGLQGRDDYRFTARLPDEALNRSMPAYGAAGRLQPSGAFLDGDLQPWRVSRLTPMQQVFSLARYLRVNGRYSDGGKRLELGYLPGQSPQRLGPGFFGARSIVGNDEQYAAFMALAANRLGVPARVVVGAVPGKGGWVRGRNVLAWVELRVADGSWRVLPTARFMSTKPPAGVQPRPTPQSYVRSTVEEDATAQSPSTPQQPSSVPPPGADPLARYGGLLAGAGSLLLVGLVPGLKVLRRWRRRSRRPAAAVVAGWEDLLDVLRDLGVEVPDGLPRTEQARRTGLSLPLARAADELLFAREVPRRPDAVRLWGELRSERRRVLHVAGALRRVRTWWAPASLLRSLRGWSRTTLRRLRRRLPRGRRGRPRRADDHVRAA